MGGTIKTRLDIIAKCNTPDSLISESIEGKQRSTLTSSKQLYFNNSLERETKFTENKYKSVTYILKNEMLVLSTRSATVFTDTSRH